MDIFDKKGVRPGIMKKIFVYGFYFLFWISSVLCAAPTENISLTIQGEDPFYSGLGVQSAGGGNGGAADSTSQLGSILNLSQNYFQIGDMNLSQGVMQQSEVDLKFPGRNGLDFTISRSYSSAKQSSKPGMNPVNQALWGPYAGNGWGFNVGMRVWVVTPGYDSSGRDYSVKVFVETCDGTEEYEAGLSKQPGNFNKTIFIDSNGWEVPVSEAWIPRAFREIRFQTTDGKTFVFSKKFFSEQYFKGQGQSAMLGYMITGYYLTRIQDSAGNMIQFSYQDLAGEVSVDANKLGPVIGQGNMDYIAKNYNPLQGQARYIKTRLDSATDTFGRVIKFGYADSTNLATQDKDQMFSSIAYTDINGNTQKIAYCYDNNGCLTSVKVGDLPAKTYGYVYFKPRYYRIEKGHYEYSCFGLVKEFKPDYRVDTYSSTGDTNNRQDVPFTTGYLLNKITTPLGAVIGYSYEDCLVTSSNAYQYFLTQSGRNTDIESGGSNHVVIQKTVNDGQSVKTYNFLYPRNSQGYLIKAKYRPPKQNYNAYYFASVTVDNPSEMVDETYTFQNAMVTDHLQGIYDTKTYWDFDRLLKAKEISFKNNVIQVQTEYQYGSYYNQISATTKKGSGLTQVVKQDITYATTSKGGSSGDLVAKNLVRLPEQSKVTDLANNNIRASFTRYNSVGQPVDAYEGLSAAGKLLQKMSYDSQGRVIQSQTPLPNGSFLTLNTSYTEGSSYIVTQTLNNKSTIQEYELKTGKLIKNTDLNGNTVIYSYDVYGRLTAVTYPDGSQDTLSYSSDLKTTTSTSGGLTSVDVVDTLGRPILNQSTGQQDVKTEYYFANLPLKLYKLQNGLWVLKSTVAYDAYLRKVQNISSDFGTSSIAYDSPALNKVTMTDPLGRQTIQTMDELGRTIQSTDASGGTTQVSYNGFGEALQSIDPRGLVHKVETDVYGRPLRGYHTRSQTSGAPALRSQTTYNAYAPDVIDSVTVYSKTNSQTPYRLYSYQYDSEGRLAQLQLNGQPQETLTYEEATRTQAKGRLTKAETPDAMTQYDFDTMGRLVKETTTAKVINKTWDIQYSYNPKGQMTSLRYPDGKLVEYTYDATQRLSTVKYNGQPVLTYAYNPNGTLSTLTYGNGKVVNYTYQKDILLSGINYNQNKYTQSYTFDTVGRITQTQHNDYIMGNAALTRAYGYTNKDELKTVQLNGAAQYTHAYDSNSNLTRFETLHNKNLGSNARNMIVDAESDQLIEKDQSNGSKILLTYDAEGNMASKKYVYADGSICSNRLYSYNYQGQLKTVSENNQVIAQYGYDHKRQRIYSNTPGSSYPSKFYYWDQSGRVIGEGVIDTQNASNNTNYSVRYIYNGNEKIAMERRDMVTGQTSMYYFVNNGQGTPVLIVDSNDQPISRINLDEWGNVGIMYGPGTEINYTGKKMDPKTNLYYFNQRYYDPELGRFLQEDPKSQSLNPYLYCGNNPLIYTDPDGQLFVFDDILIAVAITALQAGATSAAINAAAQYVMTGSVNMQSVWNSFGSGALSGALSFGVGEMMGHATEGLGKTLAHGVSGGLQSMANGGNFGSGFIGGAVGNMAGEASKGMGMLESAGVAGLASGTTAWASGGDFATGFQAGANNVLYNKFGDGVKQWVRGALGNVETGIQGIPDIALDLGGLTAGLAGWGLAAAGAGVAITGPIGLVGFSLGGLSLAKTGLDRYEGKIGNTDFVVNGLLNGMGLVAKPGLYSYKLAKSSILYNSVRGNYGGKKK